MGIEFLSHCFPPVSLSLGCVAGKYSSPSSFPRESSTKYMNHTYVCLRASSSSCIRAEISIFSHILLLCRREKKGREGERVCPESPHYTRRVHAAAAVVGRRGMKIYC